MAGAMLSFPKPPGDREKRELLHNVPEDKPQLSRFSPTESLGLLEISRQVKDGMSALIEFVDQDRLSARAAGVETIAIELAAERKNLAQVQDALEESVRRGESLNLTHDGLALLRRMEKLLAEASQNIARFTGVRLASPLSPLPVRPQMGQTSGVSSTYLLIPAVFFGIVSIALVGLYFFTPRK